VTVPPAATADVRPAAADDVERVQAIGVAAGRRFSQVDDPRIAACADDPPLDPHDLHTWITEGRAWVAVSGRDVCGFVLVDVVDQNAHVEEIAVHPDRQGRGVAVQLLDAVDRWARAQGRHALTLTTFAAVEWNRPYYERRGFRVLPDADIGPELRRKVAEEHAHGLLAELRVCMSRAV
jgi:GNAT superfamily N-acetyltransferase